MINMSMNQSGNNDRLYFALMFELEVPNTYLVEILFEFLVL